MANKPKSPSQGRKKSPLISKTNEVVQSFSENGAPEFVKNPVLYTQVRGNFSLVQTSLMIAVVSQLQDRINERIGTGNLQGSLFRPEDFTGNLLQFEIPLKDLGISPKKYGELESAKERLAVIILLVLGSFGFFCGLGIYAVKNKFALPAVLFFIAFVLMLCMGYLSSKDSMSPLFNWIDEIVNCLGQGSLLVGTLLMNKNELNTAIYGGGDIYTDWLKNNGGVQDYDALKKSLKEVAYNN